MRSVDVFGRREALRQATTHLARAPAGPGADALVAAFSALLAERSGELAAALRDASPTP